MDPRVQRVLELLSKDLGSEITLEQIAQVVNLSASRLRCLFRAEVGVPFSRYLKGCRMERARGLLGNTFLSIKEVAARAGFNDMSHFVRDFKKAYGLTPLAYRQRKSESQLTEKDEDGSARLMSEEAKQETPALMKYSCILTSLTLLLHAVVNGDLIVALT
jgi:AraC-like DNA-binding protein